MKVRHKIPILPKEGTPTVRDQHDDPSDTESPVTSVYQGPPSVRIGRRGWTWPSKGMVDRMIEKINQKKRLKRKERQKVKKMNRSGR